ncbi:hypothetical protein D3C86_2236410 [compost metagenome]
MDAVVFAQGFGAIDDVFVGLEAGDHQAAQPAALDQGLFGYGDAHDTSWRTG